MNENFKKACLLDCTEFVEKKKTGRKIEKNGKWIEEELTYLSWASAWEQFKAIYPDAKYCVKKFDGKPFSYDENTGYMVFTEVTADGLTYEMWLPVMDGANKAMKAIPYEYQTKKGPKQVEAATMFDINTAIMRCLTKNLAMFGLGLYIYKGEDIPKTIGAEGEDIPKKESQQTKDVDQVNNELDKQIEEQEKAKFNLVCEECGKGINRTIHDFSCNRYGKALCMECQNKYKNRK